MVAASVFALLVLGLVGRSMAGNIAIANPGFESPVLAPGFVDTTVPPGWSGFGYSPGVWNIQGWTVAWSANAISNHNQVAFMPFADDPGGASDFPAGIYQTLSTKLAASTIYTLGFDVGSPFGLQQGYTVQLMAGRSLLAQTAGIAPEGDFTPVSLTYVSGASVPANQFLKIRLIGNAAQIAFDNITLSAVPEPSTLAGLMGLGLAGLGLAWRRRNR
jgi:hypothetical protein